MGSFCRASVWAWKITGSSAFKILVLCICCMSTSKPRQWQLQSANSTCSSNALLNTHELMVLAWRLSKVNRVIDCLWSSHSKRIGHSNSSFPSRLHQRPSHPPTHSDRFLLCRLRLHTAAGHTPHPAHAYSQTWCSASLCGCSGFESSISQSLSAHYRGKTKKLRDRCRSRTRAPWDKIINIYCKHFIISTSLLTTSIIGASAI